MEDLDRLQPIPGAGQGVRAQRRLQDLHSGRVHGQDSTLGPLWGQGTGIRPLGCEIPAQEQGTGHLGLLRAGATLAFPGLHSGLTPILDPSTWIILMFEKGVEPGLNPSLPG